MSASKKGKKQNAVTDDEGARDCLEVIRHDVEVIKSNQATFKEESELVKQKLNSTCNSLNLKFEILHGELHDAVVKVQSLEGEVNKHIANIINAFERPLSGKILRGL